MHIPRHSRLCHEHKKTKLIRKVQTYFYFALRLRLKLLFLAENCLRRIKRNEFFENISHLQRLPIFACWLFTMWFTTEAGFRSLFFSWTKEKYELSDLCVYGQRNLLCSCATIHWVNVCVNYLFFIIEMRESRSVEMCVRDISARAAWSQYMLVDKII